MYQFGHCLRVPRIVTGLHHWTAEVWSLSSSTSQQLNTLPLHSKEYTIIGVGGYQGVVYLTTQHSQDRHPCPRLDSNPQSPEASGRRPMPLDRAVTGIGYWRIIRYKIWTQCQLHFYCGIINDAFGKHVALDGRMGSRRWPRKLWTTRSRGLSWNLF